MKSGFRIGFLAIVVIAGALRFWALDAGLPHLMTRPDEEVLLLKTGLPAQGSLDLEYDVRHPGVPSAYIFLLWGFGELTLPILQAFGGAPPGDYVWVLDNFPARILILERILSALFGVATVAAVMLFVRREWDQIPALGAGLLLATCFLHVRESHSAKPDVALAFWALVALGLLAPLARRNTPGRAASAGAAIGLGLAMKPPAVLLFLPAWVATILGSSNPGWRRLVSAPLILLGAVATGVFVITSPDVLFNPHTREQLINIVYLVFPDLGPEKATSVAVTPIEDLGRPLLDGYLYYFDFVLRYGVGWLMMIATPVALVWGFVSRKPLAILSSIFVVLGFAVFGASPALLARYLVPLLPAIIILIAGAVWTATQGLASGWRAPVFGIAIAALAAQPLAASVAFDRILSRTDTRLQTTQWLQSNLAQNSTVGIAGTVFWGWGEPWMPPGIAFVRPELNGKAIEDAGIDILVTHDHPLFSSTLDREKFSALEPSLKLVAEFDPFLGDASDAQFDEQDAYYVPLAGLDAVERPGPRIRIYELR